MQIAQIRWRSDGTWDSAAPFAAQAQLVLVFADADFFHTAACYAQLRALCPQAHIVGCSSAGNVLGMEVSEGDVVATIVKLERCTVRLVSLQVAEVADGYAAGTRLMAELAAPELRHVFVLGDGLLVNGSALAQGLNQAGVPVTGGLAGDGARFGQTWVMADAPARSGCVAALGFYGAVTVRSGCHAGWDEFGAERIVTRAVGNVVHEIDAQPALQLYKRYLGELAAELPASGLRFPLSIQRSRDDLALTRTLLAVDEAQQSLTFAGDVPQGYLCKLMRTNLDSLIDSAARAARDAHPQRPDQAGLCLVVSCVGRKLVLGQLVEEELEVVRDTLGEATAIAGFYSYGELAPFSDILGCELHNQTMTLTTLYED